MGQIQNGARNRGSVDAVSSTVRSAVQPLATGLSDVANGISDFSIGAFSGSRLQQENRRLNSQLQALAAYQDQIDDLQSQLAISQKLGSFGPVAGKTRVPARVIGYQPYERMIEISAGKDQGIRPGDPVMATQGLVGTVLTTEDSRSQVMLLEHPKLIIGALDISRMPPSAGLFRNAAVTFEDPQTPVEVGDVVVTSGFSDRIPRGIIIGKVIFVDDSQEMGTRRAMIDPAVSIGVLRDVQVLR